MIYPFVDRRPVSELAPETERLRSLLADLERIQIGHHPDGIELAGAPTIEHWSLAERRTVALVGKVNGHPTIPNGRSACTSDLWFIAPALGYARTLNRFYALGERHHLSDRWDFR
ncbi:hypothetical protein FQV39_04655 [Bosea sp. F3-2]|uniref:DUF6634 family protein n=1 Tax=Bosea sp. F3-2 TaxID=2599640 RepID=UPI0011EE1F38|nr:DUF6634 family protein [Bosea sp. F3-2]QEL21946.1 hypothetical protein FQV39_04655 [Bosea sp. F3-2]